MISITLFSSATRSQSGLALKNIWNIDSIWERKNTNYTANITHRKASLIAFRSRLHSSNCRGRFSREPFFVCQRKYFQQRCSSQVFTCRSIVKVDFKSFHILYCRWHVTDVKVVTHRQVMWRWRSQNTLPPISYKKCTVLKVQDVSCFF